MYCQNCGQEIDDHADVCIHCGRSCHPLPEDRGGFGWNVLGFFIPLVGLILYLVWKTEKPITARAVGMGALVGVGVRCGFYILTILLGFGAMTMSYLI